MSEVFSQLGFGGAAISSMKSYTKSARLLKTAFDLGIRHYDTALSYGQGYSEVIYGKFIRDKRKNVTITTKFGRGSLQSIQLPVQIAMPLNYWRKKWKGAQMPDSTSSTPVLQHRYIDKQEVELSFESSLKRLQTDYVDYYFLHEALPIFLRDEALTYLLDLKQKGRVRYLGIGTNITFISTLDDKTLNHWDVLQYEGGEYHSVDYLMKKFPDKIHFHHSCLKELKKVKMENIEDQEAAGFLLAQAAKRNLHGKIIFSTRKEEALQQNIAAYEKFI